MARVEDTYAWHAGGATNVVMALVSAKLKPSFSLFGRVGVVTNSPNTGAGATGVTNPALGAVWGLFPRPELKIALSLTVTAPVGAGGGDSPDPATIAAMRAGAPARSAMDNALFAVNDFTIIPGVDIAWVDQGFTLQAEATVLQLNRVRGAAVQKDEFKTNFTTGLFAGYFLDPALSLGAELRYQRWLTTPAAVAADPTARDNLSAVLGLRGHLKLDDKRVLRPGVSFAMGLAGTLEARDYRVLQIDLPMNF